MGHKKNKHTIVIIAYFSPADTIEVLKNAHQLNPLKAQYKKEISEIGILKERGKCIYSNEEETYCTVCIINHSFITTKLQ